MPPPARPAMAMRDHQATSSPRGSRSEMRRASRPTQIETVSRDGLAARRNEAIASGSRPAAASQPSIVSRGKPRRRWAKSSRMNSSSCGAKSTIDEPPAGPQRPRRLAQRPRAVVEIVQDLVDDHEVVGARARPGRAKDRPGAPRRCGCRPFPDGPARPRAFPRWHRPRPPGRPAARTVRACARCPCRCRAAPAPACRRRRSVNAASTTSSRAWRARMRSQSSAWRRKYSAASAAAGAPHLDEAGAVARQLAVGPIDPIQQGGDDVALQGAFGEPEEGPGPLADRSTRPASTSSLRWREIRGCDWPSTSVDRMTLSSPSARTASRRSASARRPP